MLIYREIVFYLFFVKLNHVFQHLFKYDCILNKPITELLP
jgi:hypothetical protein